MNGNFYYIIVTKWDDNRYYARVDTIGGYNNLVGKFTPCMDGNCKRGEVVSVNACKTKKRAEEIANHWNECYKNNGTYI